MKPEDLGLAEPARSAAAALYAQFPDVLFTSGRRGVGDQARAMASNIVANRRWIAETYMPTAESQALQKWVDTHPAAVSQDKIAQGLAGVMVTWTDAQKGKVSKHFSGEAFDVQPVPGDKGKAIKAYIRTLPGLTKFLEKEGGLVRWHAQFA